PSDAQVIDRGEVPDLDDLLLKPGKVGQAEAGHCDVPLDEADAAGGRRVPRLDLADALTGEVGELLLDEADDLLFRRAREDSRDELRSEETGKSGEEMCGHEDVSPGPIAGRGSGAGP